MTQDKKHDVRIVVLPYGWVVVGIYERNNDRCRIATGATITRWGTSAGLGELATKGPLGSTRLDPLPTGADWHPLGEIFSIPCDPDAWADTVAGWLSNG